MVLVDEQSSETRGRFNVEKTQICILKDTHINRMKAAEETFGRSIIIIFDLYRKSILKRI